MGMFDSVIGPCPACNAELEFQSKAGERDLNQYGPRSVPPEIAKDLDGDWQVCENCGVACSIVIVAPIPEVKMRIQIKDMSSVEDEE